MSSKVKFVILIACIVLLAAGLFFAYKAERPSTPVQVAEDIAKRLSGEIKKAEKDLDRVSETQANEYINLEVAYPIFVFQKNRLIYWSDNSFVPSYQDVSQGAGRELYRTGSEAYLLVKREIGDDTLAVSAVKLLRRYPIVNDYLMPEFNNKILRSANVSILEPSANLGTEVCIEGECLLRISFIANEVSGNTRSGVYAVVLLGLSILLFCILVYQWLPFFTRKSAELGLAFLAAMLLGLRLLMLETNFPGTFIIESLFDPQSFASSAINPSLADLFLNLIAVLLLCFFLFRNYTKLVLVRYIYHPVFSWVVGLFSSVCILFGLLFPIVVIQTLYNNSAITLDISQSLQFDTLRVVALMCVLMSCAATFLFCHGFIRLLVQIQPLIKRIAVFVAACIFFAIVNELTRQQYLSTMIIGMVYLVTVSMLKLHKKLHRLSFATFAYLFAGILFLSLNSAYAIQHFTRKEKIENQFRFATNFLIDRDYFGEYLLHETAQKIAKDIFIQMRIASPFLGKDAIRQKIRQVFLPTYFNKYDVDIFLFNAQGEPIDANVMPLSQFLSLYDQDAYRTVYEGIRFVNNPELDITQKYLMMIPVRRGSINAGFVIVQLSLKRIIPQTVYPELLVDYSYQQYYRTQDLSYAVYSNNSMAFSSGEFNYDQFFIPERLGNPDLYTIGIIYRGYEHIAVEDPGGKIAVVSSKEIPFIYRLSNFSFLLALGLLMVLFMLLLQGALQYVRGTRLFFSARIQLYLNLAFFIPLIIVSVSTLGLTSRSSQQQLNDEYLSKSRAFSQQLTNYLDEDQRQHETTLVSRLTDLAKLSNLDANLFNSRGTLLASSQPLIFETNLLSSYISAKAYDRVRKGENLFVEAETVGKLEYFVSYSVLKSSATGQVYGILGIPFFQSAFLLERVQSVVLINILNIFAFIFIVLIVLSYVVADRLTFPLRFITQSLKSTSLTNSNKPLTWPSEDEIGLMVKEYNSMLFKLSESKSELERTQREKAWREIAQQVAHEIKNPLTPMKLTLQQLERALQNGNNTQEKTARAVSNLLTQVDTLNDIASSFSGFVKMPEPVIQRLDLVTILKRVVDLHSPTGKIDFTTSVKDAFVMGDEQLLSRTFSNLILNALQSGIPGQAIDVEVVLEQRGNVYRMEFRDNGKGIPKQIADSIFIPHFTTKKSGSGLGLAISKQAIEQMKGKIWFETEEGNGTTFFIELPRS
jgi:two-component system, NtrC family, nitrogen regulation sensor histidine kinase NtrY